MFKSLRVVSINCGRMLQPRTREFLEMLSPNEVDVILAQDLPYRDMGLFERWPFGAFAPMTNHLINGVRAVVGIAMVSRYFMRDVSYHTTWGNSILKNLLGLDDHNHRIGPEFDPIIEATEDRVLICARVVKESTCYDLATTHGMWARGGKVSDPQRQSTEELLHWLKDEGVFRGGLVFAGDMNFHPGDEIYAQFIRAGFVRGMPLVIDSTLDPEHPLVKRGIKVITDLIFTLGGRYVISNVRLQSGVSDHQALFFTVSGT